MLTEQHLQAQITNDSKTFASTFSKGQHEEDNMVATSCQVHALCLINYRYRVHKVLHMLHVVRNQEGKCADTL